MVYITTDGHVDISSYEGGIAYHSACQSLHMSAVMAIQRVAPITTSTSASSCSACRDHYCLFETPSTCMHMEVIVCIMRYRRCTSSNRQDTSQPGPQVFPI